MGSQNICCTDLKNSQRMMQSHKNMLEENNIDHK